LLQVGFGLSAAVLYVGICTSSGLTHSRILPSLPACFVFALP
jgi:hypothetical protein